jgi:hypothetical protein
LNFGPRLDQRPDIAAPEGVEVSGRLVEDQQLGPPEDRLRDAEAPNAWPGSRANVTPSTAHGSRRRYCLRSASTLTTGAISEPNIHARA